MCISAMSQWTKIQQILIPIVSQILSKKKVRMILQIRKGNLLKFANNSIMEISLRLDQGVEGLASKKLDQHITINLSGKNQSMIYDISMSMEYNKVKLITITNYQS